MRGLNETCAPPSERVIHRIMQAEDNLVVAAIRASVQKTVSRMRRYKRKSIGIIIDIYTDDHKKVSYIGVYGTWLEFCVDKGYKYCYYLLECCEFPRASHSGANIATFMREVFNTYGINLSDIILMCPDGASNGIKAAKILGIDWFVCFCHNVQRCVSYGMDLGSKKGGTNRKAREIIRDFTALATLTKRSAKVTKLLKQSQHTLDPQVPIYSYPKKKGATRWAGLHTLFQAGYLLKVPTRMVLNGTQDDDDVVLPTNCSEGGGDDKAAGSSDSDLSASELDSDAEDNNEPTKISSDATEVLAADDLSEYRCNASLIPSSHKYTAARQFIGVLEPALKATRLAEGGKTQLNSHRAIPLCLVMKKVHMPQHVFRTPMKVDRFMRKSDVPWDKLEVTDQHPAVKTYVRVMQRETKARFFKHPFPDSFFLMIKLNPYSSAEVVFRDEPRLAARCKKVWKRSYNAIASAVFAKHTGEVLPTPPRPPVIVLLFPMKLHTCVCVCVCV